MSAGFDSTQLSIGDQVTAARNSVVVYDASEWGRIVVSDGDRLRFLHNQTTNTFQTRQPGEGCDTVFVTSTGRTIDLATAYVQDDSVLLLVSPTRREFLMDWLDRFIFFADKVKLADVTAETTALVLIGPESDRLIDALGAGDRAGQPYGSHALYPIAGAEVRVAVGSGLGLPGYTLMAPVAAAEPLRAALQAAGATQIEAAAWERLRIEQGRPMPDRELTEDYNPLEAGLWHTISLNKGCYIGQETIARLHTYRGVKQQLWGVQFSAAAPQETVLTSGEDKVGHVTSVVETESGALGLAYIRTKAIEAGLGTVQAGNVVGTLVPLPFLSHEYL
ncbi:folate-binding protein YgfZ [Thermoleptolyngbya oregonensis NK1-22]|uniref:Folate-binding protein YgfZ n=1 Tax=Thermoleptolyngbya oregonensis NK1-22 TaxID=2547457 RepID=A0AA97B9N5_9CYAN|nr:folate-binding protein [Thermoleptolyngbya oregonensis]WOB42925.1 folate-binding protein YgfZ [Thermoleptolyngbya oregonensis NK1-22]